MNNLNLLQFKFSKLGEFITLNDELEFQNTTTGMYDARKEVQEYVTSSDSNPIVCWLDSDLVNSVLVHDRNRLKKYKSMAVDSHGMACMVEAT